MVSDIRINIGLTRHKKYKRLKRLLGESPAEYLLNYWGQVAEQQPDGETDWDAGDIEDFADWTGEEGLFVNSMVEVGFLTQDLKPHNWDKRQSWAIGAEARSERARRAAEAKWNRKHATSNASSMRQACAEHAQSNAGSNAPLLSFPFLSLPLPSLPNQTPKPSSKRKVFQKPSVEEVAEYCTSRNNGIDPQKFCDHYEAKGWKIGNSPMKDWKAAVRTWEGRDNGGAKPQQTGIKRKTFSGVDYGETTVGEI